MGEVDPDEPVANIRTMNDVFDSDLLKRNTQMTLVAVFAGLALAMASIGLYGVLSYASHNVSRKSACASRLAPSHEASRKWSCAREPMLALTGIALGVAAGLAGGPLIESLL